MTKEISVVLSDEQAAALRAEFPVEESFQRTLLPRLGMYSQDKTEGKGKNLTVVAEAGVFFVEHQTEEVDEETGKKVWEKTELGTEIEGIILYQRKQLRFYDSGEQLYTSSPIYDTDDEVIPLFKNKVEVAKGTPKQLQSLYPGTTLKGKPKSKLEDERVVYVLGTFNGEPAVYQLGLRGTSKYEYMNYTKSLGIIPPAAVLTRFNSEPQKQGTTEWNKMTFAQARRITPEESNAVLAHIRDIKAGIAAEKAFFGNRDTSSVEANKEWEALTAAKKDF